MSLSRKDYEAVAQILKRAKTVELDETAAAIADGLIQYFTEDNPRFDKVRFLKAAGWW